MGIPQSPHLKAGVAAKRLLPFVICLWILAGAIPQMERSAAVVFAYFIPFALLVALVLARRLVRAGPSPIPWVLYLAGLAFILLGALLDIAVTIVHTPDLSQEQNPFARLLLDSGHSVAFVYGYAFVAQTSYLTFLALLLAGMLRHRRLIWGRSDGVLGSSYYILWGLAVILLAATVDRWYLSAEWLGLVSEWRWPVLGAAVGSGLVVYVVSLWLAPALARGYPTATPVGANNTESSAPEDRPRE